ncbi:hypothetical protein [Acidithiobacillus thiooxidans]|uniref:hypothetical protein n=1 Tax=Acidithiobacillus thiooxidans TaxID=930 RepID=UPI0004E0B366|nr:hypothetical protein [Acidithiobacillus thiooxidans]
MYSPENPCLVLFKDDTEAFGANNFYVDLFLPIQAVSANYRTMHALVIQDGPDPWKKAKRRIISVPELERLKKPRLDDPFGYKALGELTFNQKPGLQAASNLLCHVVGYTGDSIANILEDFSERKGSTYPNHIIPVHPEVIDRGLQLFRNDLKEKGFPKPLHKIDTAIPEEASEEFLRSIKFVRLDLDNLRKATYERKIIRGTIHYKDEIPLWK